MTGKITKFWTDVCEVEFANEKDMPKIDSVLTLHEGKSFLLTKIISGENSIRAILIYGSQPIKIGDQVIDTKTSFMVPVGQNSKNNIYDFSGKNFLPFIKGTPKYVEMNSTISENLQVDTSKEIMETGIKVIDFFIPILKGSKLGIFGGAGVGKTVLMKEIIFNSSKKSADKKTTSIFVGAGERSREGVELYQELENSNLMQNSLMFISKMNERPGARMAILPIGITAAEYFRDVEKEDVLLFVDNTFRFVQAGNEVSASMGKKPSIGGYQPTLDSDVSQVQDRLVRNENGAITSFQTVFLPMDDITDPSAVAIFGNLEGALVLSRDQTAKNIFPAFDPLTSFSNSVKKDIIGEKHFNAILETKKILQKYQELENVILILGVEELDFEAKKVVRKALQLQNFFTQNFFMTEIFTKKPGNYVSLAETIDSVIRILNEEYIQQSPEIFSYVGSNLDIPTDKELGL